ncbi:MAG: hypothetical protein AAGF73_12660 [Actinomycetota bacterium]
MTNAHTDTAAVSALAAGAVLNAGSTVVIGSIAADQSTSLVSATGFFVSIVVLWTIRSSHQRPAWTPDTVRLVIAANVRTCAEFVAYFLALEHLEPSLADATLNGTSPLAMAIAAALGLSATTLSRRQWIPILFIAAGLSLTAFTAVSGRSALPDDVDGNAVLGVLLAMAAGVATAAVVTTLKRLSMAGWSNLEILRYRFGLLVVVSAALSIGRPLGDVTAVGLGAFVVVVLVGVTLPLWLIQFGISRVSVLTVLVLGNLGPLATYALELFDPRLALTAASGIATALTCVGIVSYAFATRHDADEPNSRS